MRTESIGSRLRCESCGVEVIVVKWEKPASVTCDDQPLVPASRERSNPVPDVSAAVGTKLGKRYVDQKHAIELLAVHVGPGTLRSDGEPMEISAPKQLPSSD
jgi:hypothetical protein